MLRAVIPINVYSEAPDRWTDPENDTVHISNYSPVWRWRRAMYNDQICRMDWCVKNYEEANHHPIATFNEDASDSIIFLKAKAGETLALDASASSDPDQDSLNFFWWVYQEAGTFPGAVSIPNNDKPTTYITIPSAAIDKQIHVILEIHDINPIASLFDYRRIVIDVEN